MTIDNYTDRERKLRCAVADLQAENKNLQSKLAQQAAMVEKCMVAMNENADRGEKAEAKLASMALQQISAFAQLRAQKPCFEVTVTSQGHPKITQLRGTSVPVGTYPLFLSAEAASVPCVVLTPEERAAFERFHETWEDNEGYAAPKEMMRRLAEVGVVHHITAGRYDITKFGHYVLAAGAAPVPTGYRLVSVEALTKWRNAFAEELSAWDIDPPLHHVQTSHDEISAILAAAPKEAT